MTMLDLSDAERRLLAYALDLAAEQMASHGDEFTGDDDAALVRLRTGRRGEAG
ncbi:hypothetical protein ACFQ3Z_16205 [Streptomyces nogalater]